MKIELMFVLVILFNLSLSCIEGDNHCAKCGGDNCLLCYNSYVLGSGTCSSIVVTLENCLSYKSATECEICNLGYKPDENGRCVGI